MPEETTAIKLGDIVKDKVSGFVGVALARTVHLFDVPRILVQPRGYSGKAEPPQALEEARLEVIRTQPKPAQPKPAQAVKKEEPKGATDAK
jgi:hypothetical protein